MGLTNTKITNMKAPTVKKVIEPVISKTRKAREKGAVLVLKTPNELAKLIGGDTPVGVSRKSLIAAHSEGNLAASKLALGI